MSEQIEVDVAGRVMTITLDRPERLNAFTPQMRAELIDAFDEADGRDDVGAVVVTGRGRAFCAGADLSSGGSTFEHSPVGSDHVPRDGGGQVSLRIYESRKPVIAAINGAAVGVGITMCLPMDVRIASSDARFGFVFVRRGIVPEATSTWFLPRIVGVSTAMEWFATGRVFDAEEALARGLVSRVVPPSDVLPTALTLAGEIADNAAPVSVALARQMVLRMMAAGHPMQAHRLDSRVMQLRGGSPDAREGVESFLEKRPPRFPMRASAEVPDLGFDDPPYEDWPLPG